MGYARANFKRAATMNVGASFEIGTVNKKTRLWHQVQEARAQARATRMARLNLLSHGSDAREKARKLARAAAEHDRRAQEFVDEMEALTEHPPVKIDWGDLTNYS